VYGTFDSDNIGKLELENPEPPSLQSNLAASNFHLFGPLKEHLEEQKVGTDDELRHGVLN
jgi:hypothetical protein